MKKLFGILGTLVGAGLAGFGIFSLVKGNKDVEVEGSDYYLAEGDEADDEYVSDEE